MLQIVFMILGIVYLFRLIGLGNAGTNLGLPQHVLEHWRGERKRQYVWGIVAGWGSFFTSVVVAQATTDPSGYATREEAFDAMLPSTLIGLAVLIIGMVVSIRASRRAKMIEQGSWGSPPISPG